MEIAPEAVQVVKDEQDQLEEWVLSGRGILMGIAAGVLVWGICLGFAVLIWG